MNGLWSYEWFNIPKGFEIELKKELVNYRIRQLFRDQREIKTILSLTILFEDRYYYKLSF